MKGEKSKLILIYILIVLVIILIIALTLSILNNKKEIPKSQTAITTPTVDTNPYPEISDECTFNLSLDEYNNLSGPKCKNGYSRYNVNANNLNIVVIYSDQNGKKAGLYINNKRFITNITNVINIKLGVFNNKLFILDNNDGSNVLVFKEKAIKEYDLKETLEENQILDEKIQNIDNRLTSKTIDSNSFVFTENNFTFKSKFNINNQIVNGSTYIVDTNKLSKPEVLN